MAHNDSMDRCEPPENLDAVSLPVIMTVMDVLTRLSLEPHPDMIAGEAFGQGRADSDRRINWGHWPVWPLVLCLEHQKANADGSVQLATRLDAEISALTPQFRDIRAAAQAALDHNGIAIGDLIQHGRTLEERWARSDATWEHARFASSLFRVGSGVLPLAEAVGGTNLAAVSWFG